TSSRDAPFSPDLLGFSDLPVSPISGSLSEGQRTPSLAFCLRRGFSQPSLGLSAWRSSRKGTRSRALPCLSVGSRMGPPFSPFPLAREAVLCFPNPMIARQYYFAGRVQGVGFRFATKQIAKGFDVLGWVRNCDDGRVELQVMGEEEEVEAFLQEIHDSPL